MLRADGARPEGRRSSPGRDPRTSTFRTGPPTLAWMAREPDVSEATDMAAFTARTVGASEAATFVVAPDGTIVSWSEEAERLFGRPLWAALGRPCDEVVAGRFPDGRPACVAACPLRLEAPLGIPPASYDLVVTGPFKGARPRLLRTHHVALRDPLGYCAGLLHVVDPAERPLRARRASS